MCGRKCLQGPGGGVKGLQKPNGGKGGEMGGHCSIPMISGKGKQPQEHCYDHNLRTASKVSLGRGAAVCHNGH